MKSCIGVVVFFFSLSAFAAGDGIPVGTVVSQLANLSLLIGGLYFSQRKTIAKAFADKRSNFLESVESASRSQKEAEQRLSEVTERLKEMQSTFVGQLEDAKKNAEESYRIQVADARNNAEKVKGLALNNIEFETQKQIENLRVETFQKSAGMAEKNLEQSLTPEQLKVWNTRFSAAGEAH